MIHLIFTELLSSTGLGHFSRCSSVYDALITEGKDPSFILNHDGTAEEFLNGYHVSKINWLSSDLLESYLKEKRPFLSFIDSYLANEKLYSLIAKYSENIVCLDDTIRITYPKNSIIFNPSLSGKTLPYPQTYKVFAGGEYVLLRKPFRCKTEIRTPSEEIQSIMISTGGSDSENLTPILIREARTVYPFQKLYVIIGPSFHNLIEIEKAADDNVTLVLQPNADTMFEVMSKVDLAITAAGQTTYELARLGVPMISFMTDDNQQSNIDGWLRIKAILHTGNYSKKEWLDLLNFNLELISNFEIRRKLAEVCRRSIDGQGNQRFIKNLFQYIGN